MLDSYTSDTRYLLNDQNGLIYNDAELRNYINRARQLVATLGECVRDTGHFDVTSAIFEGVFSSIRPDSISDQCQLINPRSMWVDNGQMIKLCSYEEWTNYVRPRTLSPTDQIGAIYKQGSRTAIAGTFFIKSGSAITYPFVLKVDGIWLPLTLLDDDTTEDIPALWINSVPYYAARLAFLRTQRAADAEEMMNRFNESMQSARQATTSSVLPMQDTPVGGMGTHEVGTYGASNTPQQRGGR